MINLDAIKEQKADILASLSTAIRDSDDKGMEAALDKYGNLISDVIMEQVESTAESVDSQILSTRGVRMLTSEERDYYNAVIEAGKSSDPKMALANVDKTMPITIIESVLGEIPQQHPLLNFIYFQDTTGITKMLLNDQGVQTAKWGDLNTAIDKEISGAFKTFDVALKKLTAWIPVSNDMLDLGASWLDRYVREILAEALWVGMETGVVSGDGLNCPIGMCKDVSSSASVVGGKYPDQKTVALNELSPEAIGAIAAQLTKTEAGNNRPLDNLIFIVNPKTYLTKVMPATTNFVQGKWVNDVMPIPCTIIQSCAVPDDRAIFGLGKRYFMGLGMAKGGKLEFDDSFKFLDDARTYKIKTYGNGKPLDSNAFRYLDISKLKRFIPTVYTVTPSET
jgi:HK97 family phage major capsid protein